jgi:hypothetical protein
MADDTKPGVEKAQKHPALSVPVHVQCEDFRCLAYRDQDGTWINYHSGEALKGTVRVIDYQEGKEPAN